MDLNPIKCRTCGKEFKPMCPTQVYCKKCSIKRRKEYIKDYNKEHNKKRHIKYVKNKKTRVKVKCQRCKKEFLASNINARYCMACRKEMSRERQIASRQTNREIFLEKCKKYNTKVKRENPVHFLYISAKGRARRNGIEFNIEESDVIIPKVCPAFGIELKSGIKQPIAGSPSLDRIDSTKGYTKGNVCVISRKANRIKNNGTIDEHKKIVEYMENELKKNSNKKK